MHHGVVAGEKDQAARCHRDITPLKDRPALAIGRAGLGRIATWGVHNIEFRHNHFESTETSYLTDQRARTGICRGLSGSPTAISDTKEPYSLEVDPSQIRSVMNMLLANI
jgi:hypothetical protein